MDRTVLILIIGTLVAWTAVEVVAIATGQPTITRIIRDWVRGHRLWGWVIFLTLVFLLVHLLIPEL